MGQVVICMATRNLNIEALPYKSDHHNWSEKPVVPSAALASCLACNAITSPS